MVRYENECCDCASSGYPCLGSTCPNLRVPRFYCDKCKEEVEKLWYYNGLEMCQDCILSDFTEVKGDDD